SVSCCRLTCVAFFDAPATTEIYPLSLYDALPIFEGAAAQVAQNLDALERVDVAVQVAHLHAEFLVVLRQVLGHALGERRHEHARSEEHTSELQSRENLVCRLLLAKKQ